MDIDARMIREQTQADAHKHRVVKHAGLGLRLRAARESLRLSENDVAARLHLKTKIISILENEDFENGPPATFLRGYLRSYARMLSIPDEEINAALVKLETTAPQVPSLETMPVLKTTRRQHRSYDYLRWMTYVVVAILVTMVSMWWASHPRDTTSFMKATSPANNMAAATKETNHTAVASVTTPTTPTAKPADTAPVATPPTVASNPAPAAAEPVAPATPAANTQTDVASSAPVTAAPTPTATPVQPAAPVQTAKKSDKNLGDLGMALAEPGLEPSSDPAEHSTHQPINSNNDSDSIY